MLNRILSALSAKDRGLIMPGLQEVKLRVHEELESPNRPIRHVYFIETGLAAVILLAGRRRTCVGLIGCEGASGSAVMLGNDLPRIQLYC